MEISTCSDPELVANIQTNQCDASLKELIKRHSALCFDMFKRYGGLLANAGVSFSEMMAEIPYLIYNSALSWSPNKNSKYSSWLGEQAKFACLAFSRKRLSNLISTDPITMTYLIDRGQSIENEKTKNDERFELIEEILNQVQDKRIQQIFKLRYFGESKTERSWAEIAKVIGMSTQSAINLHEKGRKILHSKLVSDACFDKI